MNVYLQLFIQFFKTGLFAVGGGYATVPFLLEMARSKPWFTLSELTDMIAISESTPGPIGVNMATFAGYRASGVPGAILATCSLVLPSLIIILIIAQFLQKFRDSKLVDSAFFGIRPAVSGLIVYAIYQLISLVVFKADVPVLTPDWIAIAIILVIFAVMQTKKGKHLHPIAVIGAGAVLGILLKL